MQAVVYTDDLALYALVHGALTQAGWTVHWKAGPGLALAGPEAWEKGEVLLWRTPWGVRAYDPKALAFLTRGDDPRSLLQGLRGQKGKGLLPGEARLLLLLGRVGLLRTKEMARLLGLTPHQVRFFLRALRNKFGLPDPLLLRLARHQVEVVGLEDHLDPLPRGQAEALLDVPGEEEFQAKPPLHPAPEGQALGA